MINRIGGRIGVVGGGTMGAGIAHALLAAGQDVVVIERTQGDADAARERIHASLDRANRRGRLSQPADESMAKLRTDTRYSALAKCGTIIETVPESPDVKRSVLAQIDATVPSGTIIGTNTSSLSIDQLADAVRQPERFVGIHFFNPVPVSELVEVVRGTATDDDTLLDVHQLARRLGKTSIEVRDFPGFATSRLGVTLGLEAIRMLEDGVADAESIDKAMALGYKHPMGPLRLTDLVGLDVRLAVADYLEVQLGPRFHAPDLLREKVARGELGKKSGSGFYDWKGAAL